MTPNPEKITAMSKTEKERRWEIFQDWPIFGDNINKELRTFCATVPQ